jgi:hypothetical protein
MARSSRSFERSDGGSRRSGCEIPISGAESATCELTNGINDDLCSGRQFEFSELCNNSAA